MAGRTDQTHTSAGRAGNRSYREALRLGLARRRLAADHRHEPVVALNVDQLLKRAGNAIDRRSLSRCTPLIAHPDTSGAPCRSPVELVGKQKLERLDFELDVPHTLERSDLGLADDRSAMMRHDNLVHLELRRRREPSLRLPEAGCLNDGALRRTAQSRPTGRAGRGRHGARPVPRGSPGSC